MYSNPPMDYPYHTPSSHQWSIPPTYSTNPSFTSPTTPSFPSFPWELFTPYYTHGSSSPKLYLNHGYSPHSSNLNPYSSSPYSYYYNPYHQQFQPTNTSPILSHNYQNHFSNKRDFKKHLQVFHPSFKLRSQKQSQKNFKFTIKETHSDLFSFPQQTKILKSPFSCKLRTNDIHGNYCSQTLTISERNFVNHPNLINGTTVSKPSDPFAVSPDPLWKIENKARSGAILFSIFGKEAESVCDESLDFDNHGQYSVLRNEISLAHQVEYVHSTTQDVFSFDVAGEVEAMSPHLKLNDDGGNDSGFESGLPSNNDGQLDDSFLQGSDDEADNEDNASGLESVSELDFDSEDEYGDIGKQSKAIDKARDSIGFFSKSISFSKIRKPSLHDNFVAKPDTSYVYEKGVFVYSDITARGLEGDPFTGTSLVNIFWKLGHLDTARKVFDKMPNKDVASWNAILYESIHCVSSICPNPKLFEAVADAIAKFLKNDSHNLKYMGFDGIGPLIKLSPIIREQLNALSSTSQCSVVVVDGILIDSSGRSVHVTTPDDRSFLFWCSEKSALITGSAKNGCCYVALEFFRGMIGEGVLPSTQNFVSILDACASEALIGKWYWNTLITGFAQNGCGKDSLDVFSRMVEANIEPNHMTFLGVLSAFYHAGLVNEGLVLLDSMERQYGVKAESDHYALLIDLLGRKNRLKEAMFFIEKVSYGTSFDQILPINFTFSTVLQACVFLALFNLGMQIHSCVLKLGLNSNVFVSNANMDVYAKCGEIENKRVARDIMVLDRFISNYAVPHELETRKIFLFGLSPVMIIQFKQWDPGVILEP